MELVSCIYLVILWQYAEFLMNFSYTHTHIHIYICNKHMYVHVNICHVNDIYLFF